MCVERRIEIEIEIATCKLLFCLDLFHGSNMSEKVKAAASQPSSSSSPIALAVEAPARQRPSVLLPRRATFGFVGDVSPGPMTLLFSDDSDCRSFSQLLAMAEREEDVECDADKRLPSGEFFMLPPGLGPFPSVSGAFLISQQEAPAHVVDQTGWPHSQVYTQPEYSCVSTSTTASAIQPVTSFGSAATFEHLQIHSSDTKISDSGFNNYSHSEERSNSTSYYIDKPCDDGYSWRKYGQKQVKGSEYPRSYYKCTHRDCPVKKKVERSLDGQITEIIYKGQHNHKRPPSTRHSKDTSILVNESNEVFDVIDAPSHDKSGKAITFNETFGLLSNRDEESGQAIFGYSDGEEVDAEARTDDWGDNEPVQKRRRIVETEVIRPVLSHKTVSEPKIVVQTRSEVDLLDDGYRWRKYGQKVVKGSSHPRSYYKCTYAGCNVRKHIERASTDSRSVITSYEGKHDHDVPTTKNRSHSTTNAGAINILQPKAVPAASSHSMLGKREYESINRQPLVGVLRMKEEQDVT